MKSFSYNVKQEIAQGINTKQKSHACLLGMILFGKTMQKNEIMIQTENEAVRDLFIKLVGFVTENSSAVKVTASAKNRGTSLYTLSVDSENDLRKIYSATGLNPQNPERRIDDRNIPKLKYISCLVAGAFLVSGSVNDPNKEYHLEIVIPTLDLCNDLGLIMIDIFDILAKYTERKGAHVFYIKESENIEDMLTLMGAPKASLELMNVKIYKDVKNKINRAMNCDNANIEKQIRTAERQIAAVELIERTIGLSSLSEELREMAEIRTENPDMTLKELSQQFNPPLSRSGVNHRLAKLEEIAKGLENK